MAELTIIQLMDQIHNAILSADFALLSQLDLNLETALVGLKIQSKDELTNLQQKAERNATCLLASGRGVRSALRRLAEIHRNTTSLITYDGSGKRMDIGDLSQCIQKF